MRTVEWVNGLVRMIDQRQIPWELIHVDLPDYQAVAEAIMKAAHTGLDGDGIVAVLPVESVYHIRTREKCQYDACD